jgi:hypothetical protein
MEHVKPDGLGSSFSAGDARVATRLQSRALDEHRVHRASGDVRDHIMSPAYENPALTRSSGLLLTPECHFPRGEHGNI